MEESKKNANEIKGASTEEKFSFRDLIKASSGPPSFGRESSNAMELNSEAEKAVSPPDDQVIYDLIDIVEETSPKPITVSEFNAEIMKKVAEVTERIAREMVPDIAERVIREEIEKLKAADE